MTNLSQPKTEIIENAELVTIEAEEVEEAADTFTGVRADIRALYDELYTLSKQCIFISEAQRTVFILWILLYRLASQLRYAPVLVIDAESRGCGKSTLQTFIANMLIGDACPRYTEFTPAGLKQVALEVPLFLDELDTMPARMQKAVANLVNTRFEAKGARSINARGVQSSFGFTCLAGIQILDDLLDSTQSRCIQLYLEPAPAHRPLAKTLDEIPERDIEYTAQEIDMVMAKHAAQLHYYFQYVKYPQQAVLTSRFGDVWRNLFDLATLLGKKYVKHLMKCVMQQPQWKDAVQFPEVDYYCEIRDYEGQQEPEIYDGTDEIEVDHSTKDFITGLKAVLDFHQKKATVGIQTKELFEYMKLLNIKDAPLTQRTLGRYMTDLQFKINKNVRKNSGYRFDDTQELLEELYPKVVSQPLYEQYTAILESQ
ncbi:MULTISPECIES: hypothetical protein [Acinetobacter]|uniref:hypothetical protein n=1 Tax=Acinetobacter TaxID=469 RepID=UPI00044BBC66|nr:MULTISPECIES: hypothetical protein [Acinetobacter]EXF56669.1 hypothetical protein J502_2238 [Acinetobacter sp. 1294596]MCK4081817.1 hypothetical protein [Acinetobacter radioresistens]MCU4607598.1 hypothetical protein [Acinetobacter radioresistens]HAV5332182.1 hypothetical protein [Acinetobacter baumannii]